MSNVDAPETFYGANGWPWCPRCNNPSLPTTGLNQTGPPGTWDHTCGDCGWYGQLRHYRPTYEMGFFALTPEREQRLIKLLARVVRHALEEAPEAAPAGTACGPAVSPQAL